MHGNDQDSDRITEFTLHDHGDGLETHFVGDSQTARSIDRLHDLIQEHLTKPVQDEADTAYVVEMVRKLAEFVEAKSSQISARIGLMVGEPHICGTCGGEHSAA